MTNRTILSLETTIILPTAIILATTITLATTIILATTNAQTRPPIPAVLDGVSYNSDGRVILTKSNAIDPEKQDHYTLSTLSTPPTGAETGLQTPIYTGKKITLKRPFYCINNGGGGSAPYAMLPSPRSSGYRYFTEPPALALTHVDGPSVTLQARRMETFEPICTDVRLS